MVEERTEDSPDLFVGKNLRKMKQLTKTNPFQKNFLWGRSELINYQNRNGVPPRHAHLSGQLRAK